MAELKISTKCAPAERLSIEQVRKQKDGLSEHVCSGYFNFFPMPLIILNTQRQIVFSNNAFLRTLGVNEIDDHLGSRPGEAMGCIYANAEESGCGTSEYCRECGALRAVLESISGDTETTYDCQLLLHEGEEVAARDLRIFVSPWPVDDGIYYVVSILDIEDEKRRRALERVFFHDILNSVGGAKGLVDVMVDDAPEHMKEMITLVQASLFGLVEEIKKQRQLLALEAREYTLTKITLQGLELIRSIPMEYKVHPSAMEKKIVVAATSVNVEVVADYKLLMRVLVNMVLNALEATEEGGSVLIGLDEEDDMAVFWVWNSQVIPRSVQLQIFKRSFSTKGFDRGLGTYSIKLLTENYLDGTVGFQSKEGVGTRFWIRLPRKG